MILEQSPVDLDGCMNEEIHLGKSFRCCNILYKDSRSGFSLSKTVVRSDYRVTMVVSYPSSNVTHGLLAMLIDVL